ncbi:hypothetical protein VKT23_019791 [Stygiomarasmius scandens]|uniref:Uncharacterized protein n=1 Tax=Marasmiellus scandens TaxID=2682957 RepID=A0ABR1IKJ6_9AGAR
MFYSTIVKLAVLASLLAPTLATPAPQTPAEFVSARTMVPRQTNCFCTSPSGCPGSCLLAGVSGWFCANYCGNGVAIACSACNSMGENCILNDDNSCFTVNEAALKRLN